MDSLYFVLFLTTCALLLAWGMRDPSRIYQYPFLIGVMFTAFLGPQAIALRNDPGLVSQEAIDRTFLMGSLCMAMGWWGYSRSPRWSFLPMSAPVYDWVRLRRFATVMTAIALAATALLPFVEVEDLGQGATGPFTILVFVAGFSIVALPIFLADFIRTGSVRHFAMVALAGGPIYLPMLLSGRRGQTAAFFMVIACSLFFEKRIVIPRAVALVCVILLAYLIPVFAAIRQDFWTSLVTGSVEAIPFDEAMADLIKGSILELRNAAAMMEGVVQTDGYNFGTGYWDAIVFQYVPGQIVGFELKEALQFRWNEEPWTALSYFVFPGSTFTAIADSFQEFWYFGALVFWLQGRLFRWMWELACQPHAIIMQAAYASLISIAMVSISHGTTWFVRGGLIIWILLAIAHATCRLRRPSPGIARLGLSRR